MEYFLALVFLSLFSLLWLVLIGAAFSFRTASLSPTSLPLSSCCLVVAGWFLRFSFKLLLFVTYLFMFISSASCCMGSVFSLTSSFSRTADNLHFTYLFTFPPPSPFGTSDKERLRGGSRKVLIVMSRVSRNVALQL